jgi:3-oxoacyl-(acyl-carrier-protein) synthase
VNEEPSPPVDRPRPLLLKSRIGRYTSLITRMAVETLEQAAEQGGEDLSTAAIVFGSTYGEIVTAFEQLDMIEEVGVPSPSRFKNSVHNTSAGHTAIATGNMGFSTSLAAGGRTFAMCLLEALCWMETSGGSVIVSVADESLPPHLRSAGRFEAMSVAFALSSNRREGLARIQGFSRCADPDGHTGIPAQFEGNPSAIGIGLLRAVMTGQGGTVAVDPSRPGWCVDVAI